MGVCGGVGLWRTRPRGEAVTHVHEGAVRCAGGRVARRKASMLLAEETLEATLFWERATVEE